MPGPSEDVGVNENMKRILKYVLENDVSLRQATLTPTWRRYCNRPEREEQGSTRGELCS